MVGLKDHMAQFKDAYLSEDHSHMPANDTWVKFKTGFARASSIVADFNTRNKLLTQKLLKQGYRYHKLRKTFSKFYRLYYDF